MAESGDQCAKVANTTQRRRAADIHINHLLLFLVDLCVCVAEARQYIYIYKYNRNMRYKARRMRKVAVENAEVQQVTSNNTRASFKVGGAVQTSNQHIYR